MVLHFPVPHFPPSGLTPNLFLHFPVLHFPPSGFTPNIVLHFPVLHFPPSGLQELLALYFPVLHFTVPHFQRTPRLIHHSIYLPLLDIYKAKFTWWMVVYQIGLLVRRHSPIQIVTRKVRRIEEQIC